MSSDAFMHYFYHSLSSNYDLHSIWGPRLPQRLRSSLTASPEPLVEGWGIQIEEGRNWLLIGICILFMLLFSGLVAGTYSWKTGDHQTGVAIGSWLNAVLAMVLTTIQLWGD
jgi:hypothetical protein